MDDVCQHLCRLKMQGAKHQGCCGPIGDQALYQLRVLRLRLLYILCMLVHEQEGPHIDHVLLGTSLSGLSTEQNFGGKPPGQGARNAADDHLEVILIYHLHLGFPGEGVVIQPLHKWPIRGGSSIRVLHALAHGSKVACMHACWVTCYTRWFKCLGDTPGHDVQEPLWVKELCYELARSNLACGACTWVSMTPGIINLPSCTAPWLATRQSTSLVNQHLSRLLLD